MRFKSARVSSEKVKVRTGRDVGNWEIKVNYFNSF